MPDVSRVYTAAGTQFAVSATLPATHDIPGFEALTFTDIGELVDGGSGGKTFNKVDHSPLGEREVLSLKGSFTQGTRDLELGRDILDAGQDILIEGLDSDNAYAFRITFQNGDIIYVTATIDSYTDNIGTIDSIVGASVSLAQRNPTIRLTVTGVLTTTVSTPGTYTVLTAGLFPATQSATSGQGTGAEFEVTLAAGSVTAARVTKTGSGYDPADTITLLVVGPTQTTAAILTVATIV
jgi:hypothetical protein